MMILHSKYVSFLRAALVMGLPAVCYAALGQAPVKGDIQVAVTFQTSGSNLDYASAASSFLYGGGAELSADLYKGIGVVASATGLHTSNSGQGIPINLVAITFGPRYTYKTHLLKRKISLYGQALMGEMNGFDGLYPAPKEPITSANSLALQFGGGLDIRLSRHFSFRALNADLLRSNLPDGTTNVQNNLRLGTGLVFHSVPQ